MVTALVGTFFYKTNEGKKELREGRGRICKQLLDDTKEKRQYWKL